MSRGRVLAALALPTVVAAVAGCGGGDDPEVAGPRGQDAEHTAREFHAASLEGDVRGACGLLTDSYRQQMERSIPCDALVEFQFQQARRDAAEFDGAPIDASSIEELELRATIPDDGGSQTANVTGPNGMQTIGLQLIDGEWAISSLSGPEGAG